MRMIGTLLGLITLGIADTTPLLGQATTASPDSAGPLSPLAFVVGSCWIGTFPNGRQTDEHCFEWVYDQQFIRDRHVVRDTGTAGVAAANPYRGETMYAFDRKANQIAWWYFNSRGDVVTGSVEPSAEGLVFPERYTNAAGEEVVLKNVWSRSGDNAYRVHVSQQRGGEWRTLWTMELTRRGPAGP